ncbi:MAG: PDZ domain-containing protein [Vicinamibacteria bacterium]
MTMATTRLSATTIALAAALAWLSMPAGAAQDSLRGGVTTQDQLRLSYGAGNSLYVQVTPDGRPAMPFESDGPGAWAFTGNTASLVGQSYTVRLENTGRSRIKVVVSVDGVNVYFKNPVVGAADRDIGSIIGPGQVRVLTGFQVNDRTAQRFVFSPAEFSEGAPIRGARVGAIEVQVYEEYEPSRERGRDSAQSRAPGAAPTIGTTAGDDVDSDVRRVSFTASTREPIARLELAYGRPAPDQGRPDEGQRGFGQLGVAVEAQADGLRIIRVDSDSLGDDIGLRVGDVITKVDTFSRPSAAVLRRAVRGKARGNYLFLEVLRGRGHFVSFKARM